MGHAEFLTPLALTHQLQELSAGSVHLYSTADQTGLSGSLLCETGPNPGQAVTLQNLAKWLRVNETPLAVPDNSDVAEDFSDIERRWLEQVQVQICVPLVLNGDLLGIAFVLSSQRLLEQPAVLLEQTRTWAKGAALELQMILDNREQQRLSAAAYRSQQLTTAGQLAASVAHEVRNPLAAVRSIVQLVRDTAPDQNRQTRMLGDVLSEVDRIDSTVTGLLGLAKPHEQSRVVSSLSDLTSDAIRFVEPMAHRGNISISLEVSEAFLVRIDAREFRQIFLNVILNACEACVGGGSIAVVIGRGTDEFGESCAEVRILDDGPGIPENALERIFDPFFTTKSTGSGLGLSVCRDLVRKSGGNIRIERATPGTLVTLSFPILAPN